MIEWMDAKEEKKKEKNESEHLLFTTHCVKAGETEQTAHRPLALPQPTAGRGRLLDPGRHPHDAGLCNRCEGSTDRDADPASEAAAAPSPNSRNLSFPVRRHAAAASRLTGELGRTGLEMTRADMTAAPHQRPPARLRFLEGPHPPAV